MTQKINFHTLIILKNREVIQQISFKDDNKVEELEKVSKPLHPYIKDAMYYGSDIAIIGEDTYTLLYNNWWI